MWWCRRFPPPRGVGMTRLWGSEQAVRAWCGNDNIRGSYTHRVTELEFKFCYASGMSIERKEPTYVFTDKQVAEKSEIARRFIETRARLNVNVDQADNFLVKRFYNIAM